MTVQTRREARKCLYESTLNHVLFLFNLIIDGALQDAVRCRREEATGSAQSGTETPAMGQDPHRVHSVIAALKRVREHVLRNNETDEWDPETYNRWVGMLDGVLSPSDTARIRISGSWLTSNEILMNLDACIAFLESEETTVGFRGHSDVIDADYSDASPKSAMDGFWPSLMSKVRQ